MDELITNRIAELRADLAGLESQYQQALNQHGALIRAKIEELERLIPPAPTEPALEAAVEAVTARRNGHEAEAG